MQAVVDGGHRLVEWDDEWWLTEAWPNIDEYRVTFHGSLENADRIKRELAWNPGAFCETSEFFCSSWYPRAAAWLVQRPWHRYAASDFVASAQSILTELSTDRIFVRPDSPLKPFAGRVLNAGQVSLKEIDFGLYYDDPMLPVIVAPAREIGREWRYVIVGREVIAGSAYAADGRRAVQDDSQGAAWQFAHQVAGQLDPPEEVYVLDVCESEGTLWLLELNPFSGADLYACDPRAVVEAVSAQLA